MSLRPYGSCGEGWAYYRPYKSTNHLKARWSRTEEHNFRRSFKKTTRQLAKKTIRREQND